MFYYCYIHYLIYTSTLYILIGHVEHHIFRQPQPAVPVPIKVGAVGRNGEIERGGYAYILSYILYFTVLYTFSSVNRMCTVFYVYAMCCTISYHTSHLLYTTILHYTLYTVRIVHHGRSPRVGGALRAGPQATHPRPGLRCPVPGVYKARHTSAPVPLLDHG